MLHVLPFHIRRYSVNRLYITTRTVILSTGLNLKRHIGVWPVLRGLTHPDFKNHGQLLRTDKDTRFMWSSVWSNIETNVWKRLKYIFIRFKNVFIIYPQQLPGKLCTIVFPMKRDEFLLFVEMKRERYCWFINSLGNVCAVICSLYILTISTKDICIQYFLNRTLQNS